MQPYSLSDFSGGIQEAEGPGDFTDKQWSELKGFVPSSEVLFESQWPLQTIGSYQENDKFHAVHPISTEQGTYLLAITESGTVWWAHAPEPGDSYQTTQSIGWSKLVNIIPNPDYRFITDVALGWKYRNVGTQEFEDRSSSGVLIHRPTGDTVTAELESSVAPTKNIIEFTTVSPHGFSIGDWVTIVGATNGAGLSVSGVYRVNAIPSDTEFRVRTKLDSAYTTPAPCSGVATKTLEQNAYVVYFTAVDTPAVKKFPDETRYINDDYSEITSVRYDSTTGYAVIYTNGNHKFDTKTVTLASAVRKNNRITYSTTNKHPIQPGDSVTITGFTASAFNVTNATVDSVSDDFKKFVVLSKGTNTALETTAGVAKTRYKICIADTFQDFSGDYADRMVSIFDGTWYTLETATIASVAYDTEDNQIVFSMRNAAISFERTDDVATLHIGYHNFLAGDTVDVVGLPVAGTDLNGTNLLITAVDAESITYTTVTTGSITNTDTSTGYVKFSADYDINESSGLVASAIFLKQDRQFPQRNIDMWFQPYTYNERDAAHKFSNKAFPGKGIVPRASVGTVYNNRVILGNVESNNAQTLKIARKNVPAESPIRDANTSPKESSIYYAATNEVDVFDPRARINMGATDAQILGLHVVNQSLIAITEVGGPQDGVISLKGNLALILPYDGQQPNPYQVRKEVIRGNIGGTPTPDTWVGHRQFSSAWPEAGAATFVDRLGGVWYTNGTSADRLDRYGPKAPRYATEYDHTACLGRYGFVYRFNNPAEYFGNGFNGEEFNYIPAVGGKLHVFSLLGNVGGEVNGAWTELIKPVSVINADGSSYPFSFPTNIDGAPVNNITDGAVFSGDYWDLLWPLNTPTGYAIPGEGQWDIVPLTYKDEFGVDIPIATPASMSNKDYAEDYLAPTQDIFGSPVPAPLADDGSITVFAYTDEMQANPSAATGQARPIYFLRFTPELGFTGTSTVTLQQIMNLPEVATAGNISLVPGQDPQVLNWELGDSISEEYQTFSWSDGSYTLDFTFPDYSVMGTVNLRSTTDHIKSMVGHGADLYLINGGNVWRYATLGPYNERGKMNGNDLHLIVSTPTIGDPENLKKQNWHRFGATFETITGGSVVAMKTQARGALSKDTTSPSYTVVKNAVFTPGYGEVIIPAGIGKQSVISGTISFAGHIQLQSITFWSTGEVPSRDR